MEFTYLPVVLMGLILAAMLIAAFRRKRRGENDPWHGGG